MENAGHKLNPVEPQENKSPYEVLGEYAKLRKEQLASEAIEFPEGIKERIPEIRNFYVEYLNALGIHPELTPSFAEIDAGSIAEWFDKIEKFYLSSTAESKTVGDGKNEFAGYGSPAEQWVLISGKLMEAGSGVEKANFYGPAALGHEIYHAMAATVFRTRDNMEMTPKSVAWMSFESCGVFYQETTKIFADLDGDGNPIIEDGYYIVSGNKSSYRAEDYYYSKAEKTPGKLFRRGNLLEEGLATILELRIRDRFAPHMPEMSARSEKAVEGWLADRPDEYQFREGIYLGDGFENMPHYDAKNNAVDAALYRKAVHLFKTLGKAFDRLHGSTSPLYFEGLIQRARILAEHDELWNEINALVGPELADRIKFTNETNIDSIIREVEAALDISK